MCQAQKSYERCIFKLPFLVEQLRLREVSNLPGVSGVLRVRAVPGIMPGQQKEIVVSRTDNSPSTWLDDGKERVLPLWQLASIRAP